VTSCKLQLTRQHLRVTCHIFVTSRKDKRIRSVSGEQHFLFLLLFLHVRHCREAHQHTWSSIRVCTCGSPRRCTTEPRSFRDRPRHNSHSPPPSAPTQMLVHHPTAGGTRRGVAMQVFARTPTGRVAMARRHACPPHILDLVDIYILSVHTTAMARRHACPACLPLKRAAGVAGHCIVVCSAKCTCTCAQCACANRVLLLISLPVLRRGAVPLRLRPEGVPVLPAL